MEVNKAKGICEISNYVLYALYISMWRDAFCLVLCYGLVSVTADKMLTDFVFLNTTSIKLENAISS